MQIAIIDDGVYEGYYPIPAVINHLQVRIDDALTQEIITEPYASHGTKCAAIIYNLCKGCDVISIKILDKKGRGFVDQLIIALMWCYEQNVKLIQMSLGSANYHDYYKINPVIFKLISKDILIVAAYHNMNIPSYPAHLPGVFGVRHDRYQLLPDGAFLLDYESGLREENSLVAHYSKQLKDNSTITQYTEGANSFAASVITAQIIQYLKYNPYLSFHDILNKLKYSAKKVIYPNSFCQFNHLNDYKNNVPVIGINRDYLNSFITIYNNFKNESYSVEGFSQIKHKNAHIIPLSLYISTDRISKGFLFLICKIYNPSVILIEFSNMIAQNNMDWELMDIYIELKEKYIMSTECSINRYNTISDVYESILAYYS